MCIDLLRHEYHGIRVAARAFVTFIKGRLKCLLIIIIIIIITINISKKLDNRK